MRLVHEASWRWITRVFSWSFDSSLGAVFRLLAVYRVRASKYYPLVGQQPARVEDIERVHRCHDHATIQDVEVDFRLDNAAVPTIGELD